MSEGQVLMCRCPSCGELHGVNLKVVSTRVGKGTLAARREFVESIERLAEATTAEGGCATGKG